MGITTEQYNRIIRFLDGEMNPTEMNEFQKELESNQLMRIQVEFEQEVRDTLIGHGIEEVTGNVAANGPVHIREKTAKVKGMRNRWFIDVAVSFLACILVFAFLHKTANGPDIPGTAGTDRAKKTLPVSQPDTISHAGNSREIVDLESLFSKYFKKDKLPDQYPLYLADALMNFEAGNYQAIQQLDLNLVPAIRGTDEKYNKESILKWGHYYKGIAFLQTGDIKKALMNFDWIVKNPSAKDLLSKSLWYQALGYMKQNSKEKALELCRSVINTNDNDSLVNNATQLITILR